MLIRSNGIATRILTASLPMFAAGLLSPSAFAAHLTWQPRVSGQSGSDVLGHAGTAGQSGSDVLGHAGTAGQSGSDVLGHAGTAGQSGSDVLGHAGTAGQSGSDVLGHAGTAGQSGSDVLGHAGTAGQSGSDAISKSLTYLFVGHQPMSSWAAGFATDLDMIVSLDGPQAIQ